MTTRATLRARGSRLLSFVLQTSFVLLAGGLILQLLETGTRILFPKLAHSGTDFALIREDPATKHYGWRPNATGDSFGTTVSIDADGYRKMASPLHYETCWVVLGDSVTFGVGVATEETFVGRLQNSFPTLKIWNTAVIGYNVENYETVVRDFLANRKDISQVILFFTLNDLGDNRLSAPRDRGWLSEVHVRVQRHFALVRLLTGLAFDRSKRTFLHDAGLYQRENTRLARSHRILAEVKAELERHGIDLLIVLLPYEYQVRMKQEADLRPQTLLKTQLERRRISFLDTYEAFARSGEDSRRFYLYLDPMHLSSHGHEIVFDAVAERLGRELARRPQPRSASHAIR